MRLQKKPWLAVVSVLGALLYDVSPIDIIPDIIPILGWIDDAALTTILLLLAIFNFARVRKANRTQGLPIRRN